MKYEVDQARILVEKNNKISEQEINERENDLLTEIRINYGIMIISLVIILTYFSLLVKGILSGTRPNQKNGRE
ncbi:MAG: hypothetical protein IPM56_00270 [Ignavibacteriales bacterium]|nr:MAG: hypothetical protein IPM56_00270 [Ignavibacteriales bacterium]